jgi:hypothetical protein
MTEVENNEVEGNEEATVEQPSVSLTLQDLTLTANIIDLAVQRGAFKAAEVQTVGAAFQKLAAIIQAVTPPKPEGEAVTEETSTEEETSEE